MGGAWEREERGDWWGGRTRGGEEGRGAVGSVAGAGERRPPTPLPPGQVVLSEGSQVSARRPGLPSLGQWGGSRENVEETGCGLQGSSLSLKAPRRPQDPGCTGLRSLQDDGIRPPGPGPTGCPSSPPRPGPQCRVARPALPAQMPPPAGSPPGGSGCKRQFCSVRASSSRSLWFGICPHDPAGDCLLPRLTSCVAWWGGGARGNPSACH